MRTCRRHCRASKVIGAEAVRPAKPALIAYFRHAHTAAARPRPTGTVAGASSTNVRNASGTVRCAGQPGAQARTPASAALRS